jgi:hypothetical protein
MKLLIIDLYGDGESLRVCEDKAGIDQIIAEFSQDQPSDAVMKPRAVRRFACLLLAVRRKLPVQIEVRPDAGRGSGYHRRAQTR